MVMRSLHFIFATVPLLVLLAGCGSDDPYLLSDYRYHQRGRVIVCYDPDTARPEHVQAIAEEVCRGFDRTAHLDLIQPNQCAWTAQSEAMYSCVPRPGETPGPIREHLAPMRHDTPLPP
jgi:hypothetical protein